MCVIAHVIVQSSVCVEIASLHSFSVTALCLPCCRSRRYWDQLSRSKEKRVPGRRVWPSGWLSLWSAAWVSIELAKAADLICRPMFDFASVTVSITPLFYWSARSILARQL